MKSGLIKALAFVVFGAGLASITQAGWSDDFIGGAQQTWTVVDGGDNSAAAFQNNRYELHTESSDGSAKSLVSYVDDTTNDGIMQARVQRINESDNFLAYLLARSNTGTMSGYVCGTSSDGNHLWFGKLTGGAYESITFTGTAPAFDPADFQVRFAVYGNTLAAKVWTTGTVEPTDWQITATDSSYATGVGGVMLATYPTFNWDVVQVAFDDVSLNGIGQDTVWVDGGWAGSDTGAEVEPGKIFGHNAFAVIQDGVDAADEGGTVHVAAGTYQENLASWKDMEITKSLTLKGAGSGVTIIELTEGKMNGVEISGDNLDITIEGITFTKRPGADNASSYGLRIAETSSSFTSFVLRDVEVAYASGRNVFFGSAGTFANVVIEDCQFHHAGSWGVTFAGPVNGLIVKNSSFTENGQIDPSQGIGLDFTSPGAHQNILIEDSDFSNNLRRGINALNLQNAVVRNVTANNNGTSGFQIWNWAGDTANVLFENCTVTGNGQDGVQIAAEPGLSVSGITFDGGTYANNTRNQIRFHNGGGTVEDITIKNATLGRFTGAPGSAQAVVFVDSVMGITLANNTLTQEEIHWNVWLMNLSSGTVSMTGNTFNGTYGVGVWTDVDTSLLDIRENRFLTSVWALYNHEDNNTYVADYNFWDDASPDFDAKTEGSIEVVIWYVDEEKTTIASTLPVINQTRNLAYATIQPAIDAAAPGDKIEVSAGSFGLAEMGGPVWEPVSITKSLTLSGAGAGATILDATGYTGHCDVIGLHASDVTIQGLTVRGGSFGIRVPGGDHSGLTVKSVVVEDADGTGLIFDGAGTISQVSIENTEFNHNGNRGIYIAPMTIASHFTLTDTSCIGNQVMGFNVQGSMDTLLIEGGSFNNNEGGSPRNTAEGPFYGFGISLENTVNATLRNVIATGNGTAGPAEGGAGIVVKLASSNVLVEGATLSGNPIGLWLEPRWGENPVPENVTIQKSTMVGNTAYGVRNDVSLVTVVATGKYWGAEDGPGPVGPGSGDTVSADVLYSPWLGAEAGTSPMTFVAQPGDDLQALVDLAQAGDTIQLLGGEHELDATLTLAGGVILQGADDDSTIVRAVDVAAIPVIRVQSSDVVIQNLGITVTQAVIDAYASHDGLIDIAEGGYTGIEIRNNTIWVPSQGARDTMGTWAARGIYARNNTGAVIENNTIYNTRTGIIGMYGCTLEITDNLIYNTKGGIMNHAGEEGPTTRIMTGNDWTDPAAPELARNEWDIVWNSGAGFPDPLPEGFYDTIMASSRANNDAYVLDLRGPGTTVPTENNRSHVFVEAGSGYDAPHRSQGNFNEPFSSVQLGINSVVAGGTVCVAAGTYAESIELNKAGIIVRSKDGAETTIIDVPLGTLTTGVQIYKDLGAVTLDGFTVQNFTSSGIVQSWAHRDGTAAHIWNNRIIPAGDYLRNGIQVAGYGSTVIGNYVLGAGLTSDWSSCGIHVVDNSNVTVADNTIVGHPEYGLNVGIAVNSEPPCEHIVITGNTIQNVDQAFQMAGYAGGLVNEIAIHFNKISEFSVGVAKNEIQGEGTVIFSNISATRNWWGIEEGPPEGAIMENVLYEPWYEDEELTKLRYMSDGSVEEDTSIGADETVTVPGTYTIGDGTTQTTVTVSGGMLNVGTLNLTAGSILEVIDGTLILGSTDGKTHTMSGTFTIFNSFGSVYIEEDTLFEGSTLSLISDIHVAPNVTLTVSGSLTLDGCTLDSTVPGERFNIVVSNSAAFKMVRTEISDANIKLEGDASEIRDNFMTKVTIDVEAGASANRIFHNVFTKDGDTETVALNIAAGTGTVTEVDGWGNVSTLGETRNNLTVFLTQGGLDPLRTLKNNDLYIQPGDVVEIVLDVSALDENIVGVEAMLGFNTNYFTAGPPSAISTIHPWENLIFDSFSSDGVYGKLDTAIGLSFELNGEGTNDSAVALISLGSQAEAGDGVTKFFFRSWAPGDNPEIDTRLTKALASEYLTPFTLNAGYITVDSTPPSITNLTATQTQDGVLIDMFDVDSFARQGTVVFTVDAYDATAGIADSDVMLTVTNVADGAGASGILVDTEAITVDDETWTRYVFEVAFDTEAPVGLYEVDVFAIDRSGNFSEILVGEFWFDRRLDVTVAMQGAEDFDYDREVTFNATDADGVVLETWVALVEFTKGVGESTLTDVPVGMVRLSAKTDVSLRRRIEAELDAEGQALASFTDTNKLLGGDLTGDNAVNMLDYRTMYNNWLVQNDPTADISGSGIVNMVDFEILKANFYNFGDPE